MKTRLRPRKQNGFVMPIVLFGLVLMSTVAVSALFISSDEHRAAQAMRLSSAAFYTAEAGLNEVFATWENYNVQIDSLEPGDSVDLGWQTLSTGATYRAVIHRWDTGDQPMYRLTVSGHTRGANAGNRTLSMSLTTAPDEPGVGYKIGACCEATATVRGTATLKDDYSAVNGIDRHPPGWGDADVCADSTYDVPGLVMKDTLKFTHDTGDETTLEGDPPLMEDASLNDDDFFQFGPDLNWNDIKDMADHVIGEPGDGIELSGSDIYPRYNADGTCDTTHPYNWGSDNPNDPCFNFFPIVLVRGELAVETDAYGQGIIILDFWEDGGTKYGSELDMELDAVFNGIILGKGCVEIQHGSSVYGAVFADGDYFQDKCNTDDTFEMNNEGTLEWSQCAVDRALLNSKLADYAEPRIGGAAGGLSRLPSRSYLEIY